jgi:hypothetical protein
MCFGAFGLVNVELKAGAAVSAPATLLIASHSGDVAALDAPLRRHIIGVRRSSLTRVHVCKRITVPLMVGRILSRPACSVRRPTCTSRLTIWRMR